MRWFKRFLVLLIGLVVLNLLTWIIIGKEQSLALAAEDFDGWGALTGTQTLHFYARYPEDSSDWHDPGAFSEGARSRLIAAFTETGAASQVLYHDQRLKVLPESLPPNQLVLGASVQSRAPFHAKIVAMVYAPGFASDRTSEWVWVFGWWPLGRGSYGVS